MVKLTIGRRQRLGQRQALVRVLVAQLGGREKKGIPGLLHCYRCSTLTRACTFDVCVCVCACVTFIRALLHHPKAYRERVCVCVCLSIRFRILFFSLVSSCSPYAASGGGDCLAYTLSGRALDTCIYDFSVYLCVCVCVIRACPACLDRTGPKVSGQ